MLDQAEYRKLKSALTRALNSKDPARILKACDQALSRFDQVGYPDDWHRWTVARGDAQVAIHRAERTRTHGFSERVNGQWR